MLKLKNNNLVFATIIFLYICSLSIGFYINEDLSTNGSSRDFYQTWPVILDFSKYKFDTITEYTQHVPLHYIILSFIYKVLDNEQYVRLSYCILSLSLPIFLFLNLKKIYDYPKINLLLISFSLILLPYFRSSSIYPNAHLTALIFLVISNYFYLKSVVDKKKIFIFLNLLFLAFSTYSMQTYVLFYIFYLYSYFKNLSKKDFLTLFIFCIILSIPGFILLIFNHRISSVTGQFSKDFFYTVANNFSLIGFFLVILLFNKENFLEIKKRFFLLKKLEFFIIFVFFLYVIFNFSYNNIAGGGGFYYKISQFLFNNNIIFFGSFLIGLILCMIFVKTDKNFLLLFLLIIGLNLNHIISQKYFEPVFLIMILIFFKNFFIGNILKNSKNTILFNLIIISYFFLAITNNYFSFSKVTIG